LEIAEQARRSGRYIESNSAALGAEIPNSGFGTISGIAQHFPGILK
jgi:hypothetical protein